MVLYSLYLFGTNVHHIYNAAEFGNFVYKTTQSFMTPKKVVYIIEDEIWEVITKDEVLPFFDFVSV